MVNVNYTAIGHRIKDKRKETGLTQKELAQKVGNRIYPQYAHQICRGPKRFCFLASRNRGTAANTCPLPFR